MHNVRSLLLDGQARLNEMNLPEIEARFMLEHILGLSFTELINAYQEPVQDIDVGRFMDMIDRRLSRVPLQYLTNEQIFRDNLYYVNEDVLIPRPETEMLVELGIDYVKKKYGEGRKCIRIVDMCTGSGCIAISIADAFRNCHDLEMDIFGVDISGKALKVAKMNREAILGNRMNNDTTGDAKVRVHLHRSDLFSAFDESGIDLVVSNPPYIAPEDIRELMPEVRDNEPVLALDGGEDGLDFYRKIAKESYDRLNEGGMLLFEIGHGQMDDIAAILNNEHYKGVQGEMDLQEFERIVYGIKLNKPD